jgi:hypothetical protein
MPEGNVGYQAGIKKRSRPLQLAWNLKGAPQRKKDMRLNALAGVAEGRKLRDKVTQLLTDAEANPEDAMVFCVFAEPDLSALVEKKPKPLGVTNGASDLKLASDFVDKLPIGFLVFVWDRNAPQQPVFGHARPLIVEDARGIALCDVALKGTTKWINDVLRKAGVIHDYRA